MEGEGNRFSLRPRQIFSTLNKVVPTRLAVNPTIQIRVERYSTLFPFHPIPGFYAFGFGCTRTPKPRPGARRRRDADEIGISMRVIVGSPGAGQYRVFSSVREHSKHRATMAQNGRQLPDTLLSREPPPPLSLSLFIYLSPLALDGTKKRTSSLLDERSFDGKFFGIHIHQSRDGKF